MKGGSEMGEAGFSEMVDTTGNGRRRRFHNFLYHGSRLFLGAVFLYASWDKILQPRAFAEVVYNYQVLPDFGVNFFALVLPWLELILALCLFAGFWLPGTTVISTSLLAVFLGTLVFNLSRGLDVQCGCFSIEAGGDPADIWTVARDLSFLAASGYLTAVVFFNVRQKRHSEGNPLQVVSAALFGRKFS